MPPLRDGPTRSHAARRAPSKLIVKQHWRLLSQKNRFRFKLTAGIMAAMTRVDDIRARVIEILPGTRQDLEDVVRIESVSADPARASEVQRSAEAVAELFRAEKFETEIVRAEGGAPAVIGHKAGP